MFSNNGEVKIMSAVLKFENKPDEIISYNPATGEEIGKVRYIARRSSNRRRKCS